jgi:hypothetical protein
MAEGRRRDAWQHTSALLAMLFNAHRDPKKSQPRKPTDFDPYFQHISDNVTCDIRVLKSILPPAK